MTGPGEVTDCQPCIAKIRPADAWSFTFEIASDPDGERAVRKIAAEPLTAGARAQELAVPDMAPIPPGETFFFGPLDLDGDGHADLVLATDRGVANAYAAYWRFDPAARQFVALGVLPILSLDPATGQLSSYERGGLGGLAYTRTQYGWLDGRLQPLRIERQSATGEAGTLRRTVQERQGDALVTVESRTIAVP